MQTSRLPVRPHGGRDFDDESFQDLLGERIRNAPWLVVSLAAHIVVLLLVWLLLPPDRPKPVAASVSLLAPKQPPVELPPKMPEKPIVDPEPVETEVTVDDRAIDVPSEDAPSEFLSDAPATETNTIPSDSIAGPVGIGGGPYGQRGGPSGGGKRGGNGPPRSPMVGPGLKWLAAHQDEDGKWDADGFMKHDDPAFAGCDGPGNAVHDVGVTALALLAFLGDNHTLRRGRYRDVVKRGVLWLRGEQQQNGLFGGSASHDFVYDHAIATYAMCEAFGLSDYRLLRGVAQRGLNYLESHRNPYGVWRYQPRDDDNDLSVTAWCIMAYESGKYFGLAVSDAALEQAAVYLDGVSDPSGMHGYRRAGERSSRKLGDHAQRFPPERTQALTAVGLFCRFFLGQDPREHDVMTAAARLITELPPRWDPTAGTIDHYYWYYGTYALFQMGGKHWTRWRKALERAVGPHQHRSGDQPNLYGSWDPVGAWGTDGGRVYSTAILTLTMQANYRYTRLIR